MITQTLSWSMLIIPWLTIFLMKKEDIKHFMPVALFSVVTSIVIYDTGLALGLWELRQKTFPFNEIMPYYYGTIPILTMWIFKFTFGRFGVYMTVNAIVDIGFAFLLLNIIFPAYGMYRLVGASSFFVWLINLIHATILYVYQMWQESVLLSTNKNLS